MHGGVGCINYPQVDQLEDTGQWTKQQKLNETYNTLSIVETFQDFSLFQSSLIWLNNGLIW